MGLRDGAAKAGGAISRGLDAARPVIGAASQAAGARTAIVGGAAIGATGAMVRAGASQVSGAFKSQAFILLFLGFVPYFFRLLVGDYSSPLLLLFSVLLLIFSGYALAQRLGKGSWPILAPIVAFFLWYFPFGASTNIQFLLIFGIVFAALTGSFALFTRGNSLRFEVVGFLPVIFFFLDAGMLPFLVDKLGIPITPLLYGLIFYMPWWSFLGLLLLPEDASSHGGTNLLINLVRVAGIFYIIILFVLPFVPDVGYQTNVVPSYDELTGAQERLRSGLPDGPNTPWIEFKATLGCSLSEPTALEECRAARVEQAEIDYLCRKDEELRERFLEFEECRSHVAAQRAEEARLNNGISVAGNVDDSFEQILEVSFPENGVYNPEVVFDPITDYGYLVHIDNPRLIEGLTLSTECFFRPSNVREIDDERVVSGRITSGVSNSLGVERDSQDFSFICEPTEPLNGTYTLVAHATLHNVVTPSFAKLAFLPDGLSDAEAQVRSEEIFVKDFPSAHSRLSRSPEEALQVNFAFPVSPVVHEGEPLQLDVSLEKVEPHGYVARVHEYSLSLEDRGFRVSSGSSSCLSGGDVPFPKEVDSRSLGRCVLDIPTSYTQFSGKNKIETFSAEVRYDYTFSHDVARFRVATLTEEGVLS